jgi:DnaJ-class molecular chaperone with C-terminal Zn finger domain
MNSNKLQSLTKITIGGVLLIISIFLLFRGLYYFSGPLLVLSLWLTRLKTLYNFYNLFFKKNNSQISMDKNEAFEILGLDFSASRDDIINAHRMLIEKNHPDKGGSDYLSAKINKARDTLLEDK